MQSNALLQSNASTSLIIIPTRKLSMGGEVMSTKKRQLNALCPLLFILCLGGITLNASADGFDYHSNSNAWGGSDEDTILIESEAETKISYSKVVNAACKSLLGLDIDKYFSGGKNKHREGISQLNDLAERAHYRIRLDQEEISLNFKLNL